MSNLNQSVRILGAGAAVIGALAGCSNRAAPAATATIQAEATLPAATATSAPAEPATSTAAPTNAVAEATATEAAPTEVPTAAPSAGQYKDGEYTTEAVRVDRWGQLQLKVTIEGGQLTKIDVLEYPHSTRRSDVISRAALPTLISEAIQKQDANVDMVTRATDTCVAFVESLEPVLNGAKTSNA